MKMMRAMNRKSAFEKCMSFIHRQGQSVVEGGAGRAGTAERPTITISRATGSGARSIAETLAAYLQAQDADASCPWAIFDKNLVQRVLQDHHLPERLARYVPDEKVSGIDYAMEELLGLHPSMWTMIQHTIDTILALARMGNVILVGRGAPVIAGHFKNAFHVRLVGSLEKRIAQVQEFYSLPHRQARDFVQREDRQRKRFLKKYFGRDIEDPLLYHMTINTDLVAYDEAARIIGDAVLRRWLVRREI
jgi:cytidylate kinase